VAKVRQFCESHIDWPYEAHFQWLPTNHGHKQGVLRGIFWFFSQVPEGIVLEDDTLPIPDFFLVLCGAFGAVPRGGSDRHDWGVEWGSRRLPSVSV
jgi:hypothetical protein